MQVLLKAKTNERVQLILESIKFNKKESGQPTDALKKTGQSTTTMAGVTHALQILKGATSP